jgi:sugar/nucleoside kinase (ribokinase family)
VIAAAETIRASGGQVVMDAGSVKPGLTLLLPLVDILVASSLFRRDYFGTPDPPDEQLLSLNVPHVITTDGERGCRWLTADHEIVQSAIDVDVVDSNGAGDVFCGALLFAITQGWPREQMLSFANTVAGLSCGNSGNYPPPQLDCVLQLMVE